MASQPEKVARVANPRCQRAFTLLEVILAMLIAAGLLVVAIYFYQQIGFLRSQSVGEIHKLSTVRLLMDKIASDLRSAHSLGYFDSGFVGGADYVQFIKTEVPAMASWTDDVSLAAAPPESDLKRLGYTLVVSVDDTNQSGSLMRWEEPNWPTLETVAEEGGDGLVDSVGLGGFDVSATPEPQLDLDLDRANRMEAGSTIFTDHVQFLRFRYFDGAGWLSNWDGIGLPMGVEIQMSSHPWSEEEAEPGEFPEDLFRRVIYVPGHRADYEAPEDLSWMEDGASLSETNLMDPFSMPAEEPSP